MDQMFKKLKDLEPEERDRIKKYIKESKDGKGSMEWMYKGDKPDSEEYLLGKKVDRHVEGQEEAEVKKDMPGAKFEEVIKRRADIDMQAKIREDPLYKIQQQQEEARKRILKNPVKMKQLQKMLDEKQKKDSKQKKHKKKKKKHRKYSSDSSEDSDDELLEKYLAIVKGKQSSDRKDSSFSDAPDVHRPRHDRDNSSRYRDGGQRERGKLYYHSDSESPLRQSSDSRRTKHRTAGSESQGHMKKSQRREDSADSSENDGRHRHSESSSKSKTTKYYREESGRRERRTSGGGGQEQSGRTTEKGKGRQYGLIGGSVRDKVKSRKRSRSPEQKSRHRSRSPVSKAKETSRRQSPKRKLTKEDMERKRREMMENAKWRDEQREKNVKSYKARDEREEAKLMEQQTKASGADFINPLMSSHAEGSSVEDRLKRNRYNIQRTSAALDKKFTEK